MNQSDLPNWITPLEDDLPEWVQPLQEKKANAAQSKPFRNEPSSVVEKSLYNQVAKYTKDTTKGAAKGLASSPFEAAATLTDPYSLVQLPISLAKGGVKLAQRGAGLVSEDAKENLQPGVDFLESVQGKIAEGQKKVEEAEEKSPTIGPGALTKKTFNYLRNAINQLLEEQVGETETGPGEFAESVGKGAVFGPAGMTLMGIQNALTQMGLDEDEAMIAALMTGFTPRRSKSPELKPSGMPKRGFENLEKPRRVQPEAKLAAKEAIESDFKNITNKIIDSTPTGNALAEIRKDPTFKRTVSEQFKEVDALAEKIDTPVPGKKVKKDLVDTLAKKKVKGFVPSEYEKMQAKKIKKFVKDTPSRNLSASELVKQYRKNNEQLGELYESGQSYAYNRAKKDALLDVNRTIAETIEKNYGDQDFFKLFKETNESWSKIMDAEAIQEFGDALFEENKINYKTAKQFFKSEQLQRPFKRALGKENYKAFETTLKDLLTTEQPLKNLKIAPKKSAFKLKDMPLAIYSPKAFGGKLAFNAIKDFYNSFFEASLSKPSVAKTWRAGYLAAKKGNIPKAISLVEDLQKEIEKTKDN